MTETSSILVLSSADLPTEGSVNERLQFQSEDPPPTEMKLGVDTRFLDLSVDTFNNFIRVYLSRYLLDCVWRDADDPSQRLTSNAGTSVSRRLKVYLYAGDPDRTPVRLLEEPVHREAGRDRPDFFLYRDQNFIYEKAHNLFDTNVSLSRELYLENQFTQQAESIADPGMYLGMLSAQAIMALRTTSQITLRWKVDRTDYPSPFWYKKFLVGSSVWNPTTQQFEVVDAGAFGGYALYHQRLQSVTVAQTGGPYFPLSLYTLAAPLNRSVAPFINNSTLSDVTDPLDGEVNLLDHPSTRMHISQVAVAGTTDLAMVQTAAVPPFAPSDLDGYRVPLVDVSAASQTNAAFTIHDVTSDASVFPSRYSTQQNQCSLHYPNGAWRGQPLAAGNTNVAGFLSPFPWERRLTAHQLAVLNETQAYDPAARYQVLDAGQYLFMDPGTAWNEQARPQGSTTVNDVTVGERSLQFDFGVGRPCFVNKCQLSFPRSQEQHQPYRMQASLQKAYNGSADDTAISRLQTLWFGGVQFEGLSGSRASPQTYKYLNTHSQSGRGLRGSHSMLWNTGSRRLADADALFAPLPQTFETSAALTRGRAGVVQVPPAAGWYTDRGRPNDVNPALDFLRQEFGPFTRGATLADLKDPGQAKAWALDGVTAHPQPITSMVESGRTFFDLVEYLASPTGASALGYKVYVQDTAATWATSQAGLDWRFLVSNLRGNRLAAAGNAYIWTYQTGGAWTRQDAAGARSWTGVATSSDGNVIVACANTASQLYRTLDFGASWAPITTDPVTPDKIWRGIALAGDGSTGFAIEQTGDIYRYQSQGGRVNVVAPPYPNEFFVDIAYATASSTVVAVSDRDNGRGILISVNDGTSWARVNPPGQVLNEMDGSWVSVAVAPEGNVVVLAPGAGLVAQATLDAGTGLWTYVSTGPNNGWSYSWTSVAIVGPPGTSRQILATTDSGLLFRYSWTGAAFAWANAGRIQSLQARVFLKASQVVLGTSSLVIAAYEDGGVHMSYNSGASWVFQNSSASLPSQAWWRAVAISADGSRVAAAEEGGYVYIGTVDVASSSTSWTRADAAGQRDWTCVGMSENGQIVYAGSDFGFLWGSTDGGQTWERDVSPVAASQNWMAVSVRQNRGFAVADFSSDIFRINLDSPPSTTPSVLAIGGMNVNWAAIDCSRDAEVIVAVPVNGLIELSTDNGENWSSLPALGTRPWTSVAVSGNGRFALAVASDGTVARGTTVNAATRLDTWTIAPAGPTTQAWSGVDVSDDWGVILATADNAGIFVSSDEGLTWVEDTRLPVADRTKPWACVAVSGDGAVLAAGVRAPLGELRVLDAAQAWTALTLSPNSRSLAEGRGPKILVEDPAFPLSSFLLSSTAQYPAANLASVFSTSVYEFFYQKHTMYLVDAQRQANPSPSSLRDDTIVKEYRRASGHIVFTTANPVSFIFEDVLGPTRVLLAQSNATGVYYLVYPWYATDLAKRDLVMNPDYTKYVLSTVIATSPGTVVVSSATFTNNVYLRWNDTDLVGAIPEGPYTSMAQFAAAFQAVMDDLKLYLVETATGNRKYFMWFEPVIGTTIRFHVENPPRGPAALPAGYEFPADAGTAWPYGQTAAWPALRIAEVDNDNFGSLIGFDIGTYPPLTYVGGGPGAVYIKSPDFIPPWVAVTIPPGTPSFQHAYEIYPGMYRVEGSLEPSTDYVVKETYYFAPQYDQYDTKQSVTIDGVATFQPSSSDVAQKMVNPSLAVGQSLGVAFGSFLFDQDDSTAPNEVYTRGPGNLMKLYSLRPMTQLFSFQTDSGFLHDKTGTATVQATFLNTVNKGMLVNVAVSSNGAKYPGKDTTTAYIHPTLDLDEQGMFYDETTGKFVDSSMYLMDQASIGVTTAAQQALVSFEMTDDTLSDPITTYTASDKNPLRRSAEFHLRFVRGAQTQIRR